MSPELPAAAQAMLDALGDPSSTELVVNRHDQIHTRRGGVYRCEPWAFSGPDESIWALN